MLFNEPKLLKWPLLALRRPVAAVSVLFNEPKLLKLPALIDKIAWFVEVSVLFNEPKLLKSARQELDAEFLDEFQCSSTSRNC